MSRGRPSGNRTRVGWGRPGPDGAILRCFNLTGTWSKEAWDVVGNNCAGCRSICGVDCILLATGVVIMLFGSINTNRCRTRIVQGGLAFGIVVSGFCAATAASAASCYPHCDYNHFYGPYDFTYIRPGLYAYPVCGPRGECSPYLVYNRSPYPGFPYPTYSPYPRPRIEIRFPRSTGSFGTP